MPSGSVVIYKGARGDVVRLKWRDDHGRQTMETLGKVSDGWTRKKATLELAKRLDQVEKGWRKPASLTFEAAAELWRAEAEIEKNWRPSTDHSVRLDPRPAERLVQGDESRSDPAERRDRVQGREAQDVERGERQP